MIQSMVAFILAIVCYCISQLQQQNKLRWQNEAENYFSFWGRNSWVRKYKREGAKAAIFELPKVYNWYHKLFKLKYKESFPLSATFLVAITDGYHLMQSLMFVFMSFGISQLSDINFFIVWPSLLVVFSLTYRLLQK